MNASDLTQEQILGLLLGELREEIEVDTPEDFRVVEGNRLWRSRVVVSPTLSELLATSYYDTAREVAACYSSKPDVLEKLSQDPSQKARLGVALNRYTPRRILHRLLLDPNETVRNAAKEQLDAILSEDRPRNG